MSADPEPKPASRSTSRRRPGVVAASGAVARIARCARTLAVLIVLMSVAWHSPSRAMPSLMVSQFKHTRWTRDTTLPAPVYSIAQTADGFLWLGTGDGLYRFDGVSFRHIRVSAAGRPLDGPVYRVATTQSGALWVGFDRTNDFVVLENGHFRMVPRPNAKGMLNAIVEAADGAIWCQYSDPGTPLLRFAHGRWTEFRPQGGYEPTALATSPDGTVWASYSNQVVKLAPGAKLFETVYQIKTPPGRIFVDLSGRVWLMDPSTIHPITGKNGQGPPDQQFSLAPLPEYRFGHPRFASDGSLWVGRRGLGLAHYRVDGNGLSHDPELYTVKDGLASNVASGVFEDRDHNIWVSNSQALERFRHADIVVQPELTNPFGFGDRIFTAANGDVYVAESDRFYRIKANGSPEAIGSDLKTPFAICEDYDRTVYLFEMKRIRGFKDGSVRELPPLPKPGTGIYSCGVDRKGRIWASAGNAGLWKLSDGRWSAEPNFKKAEVLEIYRSNLVVMSPQRGIFQLDGDNWIKIAEDPTGDGVGVTLRFLPTRSHLFVTYGRSFGVVENGHVRTLPDFPGANGASGLVETKSGDTWLFGRGVFRARTADIDRLVNKSSKDLKTQKFDLADGLPDWAPFVLFKSLTMGGDGRLWISSLAGVSYLDPKSLNRNLRPPSVSIDDVIADGKRIDVGGGKPLPAGTANLRIAFAVPNMTMPERVQVRYMLEGFDKGWSTAGARREAFYTNLPPGTYHFRVNATNESGVSNEQGRSIEIQLPPTFLQSTPFKILVLLVIGLLLWLLYRIRLAMIGRRIADRFQERIRERERIARDLHDTLLQNIQGLLLRFRVATDQVEGPARGQLEATLVRTEESITEMRQRVFDLRSTDSDNGMTKMVARAYRDADVPNNMGFKFEIVGREVALQNDIALDLESILIEALRNATRHSRGENVQVIAQFGRRSLTLFVKDDGVGITEANLAAAQENKHFGVIGMRERTERIGGRLSVAARKGGGTSLRLTLPLDAATVQPGQGHWSFTEWWTRRWPLARPEPTLS
jgi:signal transduction histidine kinase/streptogramin lyase